MLESVWLNLKKIENDATITSKYPRYNLPQSRDQWKKCHLSYIKPKKGFTNNSRDHHFIFLKIHSLVPSYLKGMMLQSRTNKLLINICRIFNVLCRELSHSSAEISLSLWISYVGYKYSQDKHYFNMVIFLCK